MMTIKIILGLAAVLVLALAGYGYVGDFAPATAEVVQPVVLNAQ